FWPIETRGKEAVHLAFDGPPIMDSERVIDKDNRISRVESCHDEIVRPPTVNDPLILGQYFVVVFLHFCLGGRKPNGFPLKPINGKERELTCLTQLAAQR